MRTHEELKAIALSRPSVRAEYERIEREEMPMLDAILAARRAAGLTQAQVAERMGTKAPAVARLENALITGGGAFAFAGDATQICGGFGQATGGAVGVA